MTLGLFTDDFYPHIGGIATPRSGTAYFFTLHQQGAESHPDRSAFAQAIPKFKLLLLASSQYKGHCK
jgi:hypothetical protein